MQIYNKCEVAEIELEMRMKKIVLSCMEKKGN